MNAAHADAAFGYAPGKIILLGEHAVVYGQPGLAMALDRGVRVALSKLRDTDGTGPMLRSTGAGDLGRVRPGPRGEGPTVLRNALARLVELCGERVAELELVLDSNIPVGAGLGSSAALSVALIRGAHRFFGEDPSDARVAEMALELERVFHGNPSGVDHTVISHGGLISFKKGDPEPSFESVRPGRSLSFAMGITGPHGGTSREVSALKDRTQRHPDAYAHLYQGIGHLVEEAQKAITEGRLAALGELMDLNQGYLNALGVSTPEIEALCAIARERGALGAKLTGAGGGGAMIALVDGDPEPVSRAMRAAGYQSFSTQLSVDG
jgi:hydroxymethylglutaryl-CoA reductase